MRKTNKYQTQKEDKNKEPYKPEPSSSTSTSFPSSNHNSTTSEQETYASKASSTSSSEFHQAYERDRQNTQPPTRSSHTHIESNTELGNETNQSEVILDWVQQQNQKPEFTPSMENFNSNNLENHNYFENKFNTMNDYPKSVALRETNISMPASSFSPYPNDHVSSIGFKYNQNQEEEEQEIYEEFEDKKENNLENGVPVTFHVIVDNLSDSTKMGIRGDTKPLSWDRTKQMKRHRWNPNHWFLTVCFPLSIQKYTPHFKYKFVAFQKGKKAEIEWEQIDGDPERNRAAFYLPNNIYNFFHEKKFLRYLRKTERNPCKDYIEDYFDSITLAKNRKPFEDIPKFIDKLESLLAYNFSSVDVFQQNQNITEVPGLSKFLEDGARDQNNHNTMRIVLLLFTLGRLSSLLGSAQKLVRLLKSIDPIAIKEMISYIPKEKKRYFDKGLKSVVSNSKKNFWWATISHILPEHPKQFMDNFPPPQKSHFLDVASYISTFMEHLSVQEKRVILWVLIRFCPQRVDTFADNIYSLVIPHASGSPELEAIVITGFCNFLASKPKISKVNKLHEVLNRGDAKFLHCESVLRGFLTISPVDMSSQIVGEISTIIEQIIENYTDNSIQEHTVRRISRWLNAAVSSEKQSLLDYTLALQNLLQYSITKQNGHVLLENFHHQILQSAPSEEGSLVMLRKFLKNFNLTIETMDESIQKEVFKVVSSLTQRIHSKSVDLIVFLKSFKGNISKLHSIVLSILIEQDKIENRPFIQILPEIANNASVWKAVLELYRKRSDPDEYLNIVSSILHSLQRLSKSCNNEEASIQELETIAKINLTTLRQLTSSAKAPPIEDRKIYNDIRRLRRFKKTLHDIQTFFQLFCEKVECQNWKDKATHIQQNLGTLVLSEVEHAFDNFEFYSKLDWLYELSQSQTFLILWHNRIDNYFKDIRQDQDQYNEDDNEDNEQELNNVDESSQNLVPFDILQNQIFQDVVFEWSQLFKSIDSKTILLKDLQKYFANNSVEHIEHELVLLYSTNKNGDFTIRSINEQWVREISTLMQDFATAKRQKEYLPHFLTFVLHFNQVIDGSVDSDPSFQAVLNCQQVLSENWEEKQLKEAAQVISPVKALFQEFSDWTFELSSKIGHDHFESLIQWLIEHDNDDDFRDLIRVCRSNLTDDELLMNSFVAISELRQYLSPLLYPNRPFSSVSQFNQCLQSLSEKRQELEHLDVLKRTFESVKSACRDGIRSPGAKAYFLLEELVALDCSNYILDTADIEHEMVQCPVKTKSMSFSDLLDMRTTLLNTEAPEELSEKYNLTGLIDSFIKQMNLLAEGKSLLDTLSRNGCFSYQHYRQSFASGQDQITILEESIEVLRNTEKQWLETVLNTQKENYWINFFTLKECVAIKNALDEQNDQFLSDIFYRIQSSDINSSVRSAITYWHQFCSQVTDSETQLIALANTLGEVFQDNAPETRIVKNSTSIVPHEHPLKIFSVDENQKVLNVCLAVYTARERLPEPEELLMCTSETTLEECLQMFRRWQTAKLHKRSDRIYSLVNIQNLSYRLQCQIVDSLQQFLPAGDHCSQLVFISGRNKGQRLISALRAYVADTVPTLEKEQIQEIWNYVADKHYSGLKTVTSHIAGAGKTHHILEDICQRNQDGDNYGYVRISLREMIDWKALISKLRQASRQSKSNSLAFHFNVAPSVSPEANAVIFQLLTTGYLSQDLSIFHTQPDYMFSFEIPNAPGNAAHKRIPICLLLPQQNCYVAEETLSMHRYYTQGTKIYQNMNEELIFVSKCLQAYQEKNLNVDPQELPVPSLSECFQLISKYSGNKENPSWTLFNSFIRYLHPQLRDTFSYEALKAVVNDLSALKQKVFDLLLRSAQQFAVRSVDLKFEDEPSAESYAERFSTTIREWSEFQHPFFIFKKSSTYGENLLSGLCEMGFPRDQARQALQLSQNDQAKAVALLLDSDGPLNIIDRQQEVSGVFLVTLDHSLISQYFSQHERETYKYNGLDVDYSFSSHVQKEGQNGAEKKALSILAEVSGRHGFEPDPTDNYTLTEDNLIKMIAILMRFKMSLPQLLAEKQDAGKVHWSST
eukprot:gb/GECH01011078.1/.p1 GENE.gb/GECH01011078.1/~~gb/GECH01011078.1/.p1  ORF type:complete len:2074 (+),score=438.52 gb/GECH01011078.1/:1-6222(+)